MSERIQTDNMVTDSVIVAEPSTLDKEEIRIIVPFPPKINPRDLITLLPDGNVPTRTPNAFIIYRKALIEAIRAEGHNLPMSSISSIASKQWHKEPDFVKNEYKRLAIEALDHSNTMIKSSSISRRRKNERWNTITFSNNSMTSRKDPKRPKKLSKNLKIQSPTPESLSPSNKVNDIMKDNINDNHDNNIKDTINNDQVLISSNIISNLNDINDTLSTNDENFSIDSVDSANWDNYVYQSPEIASISNNNDGLFENVNLDHLNLDTFFQNSFINNLPILSEVPQWSENDANNSSYYYDTNSTNQFDKNINDSFFLPEFPYSFDTGKLCLDTLKNFENYNFNYNIPIYP
ncbi:10118_t:CDS:1 [Gigaspora margarita]|uniref:10118_t:CDS:1 n=1 Tax=Gigaspora margarita TaxID=4874 RepID=A0ABN7V5Q4_GIGMA|nr:10118_t:CDS:1 [Gigaspora margarita]